MNKKVKRIVSCFACVILMVCIFFPYLKIDGSCHTIIYLLKTLNNIKIEEFLTTNNIYTDNPGSFKLNVLGQVYAVLIIAIMGLIKTIFLFVEKEENHIFRYIYLVLSLFALYFNFSGYGIREISGDLKTAIFPAIPFLWGIVVFLVERIAEVMRSRKEKK